MAVNRKKKYLKTKKHIEEKMSEGYEVYELAGISPRLRIVGLTEKYSKTALRDLIVNCNSDILSSFFLEDVKLLEYFLQRKIRKIYQEVI